MTNESLSQALDRLNQELREAPQLDEDTAKSLQYLIEGIHATLQKEKDGSSAAISANPSENVVNDAQGFITQFELSHPRLTNALSQVIDRLSDMGI